MKLESSKVGILIVFYNDKKHIKNLAHSLNNLKSKDFKIYVLDNNPNLNHVVDFRKLIPELIEVKNTTNIGFAKGNNILAKEAIKDHCDYLWILNPDMEPEPDSLGNMLDFIQSNKKNIAVGPLLLFGDSKHNPRIQLFGCNVNFNTQEKQFLYSDSILSSTKLPTFIEVNLLNGGSLLIKSEFVNNNYLFDERYFLYNDEIDLMKRIAEANYSVSVISNALVYHNHDWSKKNNTGYYTMFYYMNRNRILYYIKYKCFFRIILEILKGIFLSPITIKFCIRSCNSKSAYFYYLGLFHGLLNQVGPSKVKFQ